LKQDVRTDMSIGILFESSETDEKGIKMTAEQMGIDLVYIPFRKVAFRLDKNKYTLGTKGKDYTSVLKDVKVVLNRAQSKNRRLFAANVLEAFGKHVINPQLVEYVCFSKLRTLLRFWHAGINIPHTVYVPVDSIERTLDGRKIHNEGDIADLMQLELGHENIVIKPDAGTHGKEVQLARDREDLLAILRETKPSIINPVGIIAQTLVPKWFYDLRIIVTKEDGKPPYCYPTALARAGFKDFRTNTFLGNMVFGVNLPAHIREVSAKCGTAIGENSKSYLLAFDAMIDVGKNKSVDDEYLMEEFDKLEASFGAVKKLKRDKTKRTNFPEWNKKLEATFQNYKDQEAYQNIRDIIEKSIEENKQNIMFHEANACPEFWEQTRLAAGINLAEPLLKGAQSIIDSEQGE
jgi:glutathione synthase/RimK-type ligase-like ATP-grasp enzyme